MILDKIKDLFEIYHICISDDTIHNKHGGTCLYYLDTYYQESIHYQTSNKRYEEEKIHYHQKTRFSSSQE